MDIKNIKNQIRIIDLLDGDLKKVAATGGGEYAGPCPICGGRDRFRVQPDQNIWLCRHCTAGKWRDPVDFISLRDGISLSEAARKLTAGLPAWSGKPKKQPPKPTYNPYQAPPDEWQIKAWKAVDQCQETLYRDPGAKALDYLYKRGFYEQTLQRFKIGFSLGFELDGLWIPAGITIPCEARGVLWYVKIRTNHTPKYTLVKGSKPAALFNADRLEFSEICLITEGEFNAMIGDQELDHVIPVASMGSASNRPELVQWGPYFMNKSLILAVYDDDEAGNEGALALRETLGERIKLAALPPGKDLNAFYKDGGNLFDWIDDYLQVWQPLKEHSAAS